MPDQPRPTYYLLLANEIASFLATYAKVRPDYDPQFDSEGEQYTSPDAGALYVAAQQLRAGVVPDYPWSSWGSGGYKSLTDKTGAALHDKLIQKIVALK